MTTRFLGGGVGLVLGIALMSPLGLASGQRASLKIVVLEGEDAVNVIQQKTAVAPVVEVRDRNNQPVGGAAASAINPLGAGATRFRSQRPSKVRRPSPPLR